MKLNDETETVKKAATGDGAALARVSVHLQKIVSDYQAHSTREIAEGHGRIEAKRLSLIALAFYPESQVQKFDLLQEEMIKQTVKYETSKEKEAWLLARN